MDIEPSEHVVPLALSTFLSANPEVRFIHFHIVDLFGILRVRVIPKTQCLQLARAGAPKNVATFSLIGLANSHLLPHTFHEGCDSWYPDWSSLRVLDDVHNASVICSVSEERTFHVKPNPEDPFERCPRSNLQQTLHKALKDHGLWFLAGFEIEFYLIDENNISTPLQPAYNYWSAASRMRGRYWACLVACVEALENAGIVVEQFHAEVSPQQYEISLSPCPPVVAVDTLTQAMEIVKRVAAHHKLRAIILPDPFPGLATSGLHAHLSMNKGDSARPSIIEDSFLAGILDRLPMLFALGMPFEESFSRVEESCLGEWVSWGSENRGTPIRKIGSNHWEFRAVDGTANMYLVLAAYIAAGILGVQSKSKLRQKDCKSLFSRISKEERLALGVDVRLPATAEEALRTFMDDYQGIDAVMKVGVLELYGTVRRCLNPVATKDRREYLFEVY